MRAALHLILNMDKNKDCLIPAETLATMRNRSNLPMEDLRLIADIARQNGADILDFFLNSGIQAELARFNEASTIQMKNIQTHLPLEEVEKRAIEVSNTFKEGVVESAIASHRRRLDLATQASEAIVA